MRYAEFKKKYIVYQGNFQELDPKDEEELSKFIVKKSDAPATRTLYDLIQVQKLHYVFAKKMRISGKNRAEEDGRGMCDEHRGFDGI